MPRRSAEPDPLLIDRNDPRYPAALATHLAEQAPRAITARGNLDVLQRPSLALFCPARSVEGMRVPARWQDALDAGRLALLTAKRGEQRRVTADLAWRRNLFVAALADAVFIAHAAPGGKTAQLAATVCAWGRPLYTLEDSDNANLVALGARPIDPHALPVH